MGVDQLVTGGDFDDPVVDSLTSDSVNTDDLDINTENGRIDFTDTGVSFQAGSGGSFGQLLIKDFSGDNVIIVDDSAARIQDLRIPTGSVAIFDPQDVRNLSSPSQGDEAYHDGSGTNTEGPAHYNGTDWISTVDGTTIN